MPLTKCPDCGREISSEAPACPGCGKPNTAAVVKEKNSKQGFGCLLILLSIPAAVVLGPFAAVLAIVGIVLVALNTRVR